MVRIPSRNNFGELIHLSFNVFAKMSMSESEAKEVFVDEVTRVKDVLSHTKHSRPIERSENSP